MPGVQCVFHGKMLPESARLAEGSISTSFSVKIGNEDLQFPITIYFAKSEVCAVTIVPEEKVPVERDEELRSAVEAAVRNVVDLLGYHSVIGMDVHISSCLRGSSWFRSYGVTQEGVQHQLGERATPTNAQILQEYDLAKSHPSLQSALACLREAARGTTRDTGYQSYKAIESLRHHFVTDADNSRSRDRKSWERMNAALRIDRSFTQTLATRFATPQRHGERVYMSEEERVDAMTKAWKVVDRFFAYISNENNSLSDEYEILRSDPTTT